MSEPQISVKTVKQTVLDVLNKLKPYGLLIFIIFVGIVYGMLMIRIGTLLSNEPSIVDIRIKEVKSNRVPHIDEEVVKKLESLKDNSVSVQSLFDEARSNPFQ